MLLFIVRLCANVRCSYTGVNCAADIDECASSPCLNQATCQATKSVRPNLFVCHCGAGWAGLQCDFIIHPCSANEGKCDTHRGSCLVVGMREYKCSCDRGYEPKGAGYSGSGSGIGSGSGRGKHACSAIDECRSSPCKHGGNCTDRTARPRTTSLVRFIPIFQNGCTRILRLSLSLARARGCLGAQTWVVSTLNPTRCAKSVHGS